MVLSPSDYDARKLVKGGIDPSDPLGTVKLLLGAFITLSVAIWLFNLSDSKGSNAVNDLMGRLTGGRASTAQDPRVL